MSSFFGVSEAFWINLDNVLEVRVIPEPTDGRYIRVLMLDNVEIYYGKQEKDELLEMIRYLSKY